METRASEELIRASFGALVFLGLALYELSRAYELMAAYLLLLGFRAALVCLTFFRRHAPAYRAPAHIQLISYLSAFLPLLYSPSALNPFFANTEVLVSSAWILMVAGTLFSIWGIVSLGRSFGVSPAGRPMVRTGAYRWLRHPIYVGYGVAEFGFLLMFPCVRNSVLYPVSVLLYAWRSRQETLSARVGR